MPTTTKLNAVSSSGVVVTVNALINAPLKNNYDPQRRLVRSEKNYFGPMGAPYLGRRL